MDMHRQAAHLCLQVVFCVLCIFWLRINILLKGNQTGSRRRRRGRCPLDCWLSGRNANCGISFVSVWKFSVCSLWPSQTLLGPSPSLAACSLLLFVFDDLLSWLGSTEDFGVWVGDLVERLGDGSRLQLQSRPLCTLLCKTQRSTSFSCHSFRNADSDNQHSFPPLAPTDLSWSRFNPPFTPPRPFCSH